VTVDIIRSSAVADGVQCSVSLTNVLSLKVVRIYTVDRACMYVG